MSIKKETHTRILSLLERINLSRAVNYFSFPFLVSKNRFVSTTKWKRGLAISFIKCESTLSCTISIAKYKRVSYVCIALKIRIATSKFLWINKSNHVFHISHISYKYIWPEISYFSGNYHFDIWQETFIFVLVTKTFLSLKQRKHMFLLILKSFVLE